MTTTEATPEQMLAAEGATARELVQSLGVAVAAGSGNKARPALSSVRVKSDGETLVVVATDSFVLWEEQFRGIEGLPVFDVLLPSADLKKVLTAALKRSFFTLEIEGLRVIINDSTIIHAVEDDYPNYEGLLPSPPDRDAKRCHVSIGEVATGFLPAISKWIVGATIELFADEVDYTKAITVTVAGRPSVRCVVMSKKVQ